MEPRGTQPRPVTLVLTDVVGSTALAHTLGDARNATLWDDHDRVARGLLADWNGLEVERTDGLLALFDTPEAGHAFALAYQEALAALSPPLQVRIGVHAGPVAVRHNPTSHVARGAKPLEADGLALSLTARVASLARSGQILSTVKGLPSTPPPIATHGHWRMKGHPDPLEVVEVHPDGIGVTPAENDKAYRVVREGDRWVPLRDVPRALPAECDRFIGRDDDLAALTRIMDGGARLVTVTGIGGTGKTRLVTHYGWRALGDFAGGVWFCDLSDARDQAGILRVAAMTLGVVLGAENPVEAVGKAIASRGRCLIVLDNFEQVAQHARTTVRDWLRDAPEAAFVVTTRVLLGLQGEVALSLPPLDRADAVDLFVARATEAVPEFQLARTQREDVEALVDLLDRLPLAIELAAARVRSMGTTELVARVSDSFRQWMAVSTGRGAHQATLRRTLDWSWDLLNLPEKRALARLSVFEGGLTLPAAEAVLALEQGWAPDVVHNLVDHSLVRREGSTDQTSRFHLLVGVQTYAADQLDAMGDRQATEARHGQFFATRGTPEAVAALRTSGGLARQQALVEDIENVVVACRRAVRRNDADVALPTLRAAWAVLDLTGPPALAATLAEEVGDVPGLPAGVKNRLVAEAHLARGSHVEGQVELRRSLRLLRQSEPTAFPAVVARVLWGAATQFLRRQGWTSGRPTGDAEVVLAATRAYQRLVETYWFACQPPQMLAAALSALNLSEPLGPTPELARAYATLALATSGLRFDSIADHYASLAHQAAEASGSPLTEAYVRFLACVYRIGHARWEEVDRDLELAVALFTEHEDYRLLGDAVTVQGMASLYRGDFAAASDHFITVLTSGRRRSNVQHQVWGALGDAEAGLRLGNLERAVARVTEAQEVLKTFASPMERARALGLEASIAWAAGNSSRAVDLAGQAVQALRKLGPPTSHYLLEGYAGAAEVLIAAGRPAGAALGLMKHYASTFPIGEPRLAWLRARREEKRGRTGRALRWSAAGLTAAERLGMQAEHTRLERVAQTTV